MIKYIKSRISVKIFLLTMVILMAVSGVSYGFVTAFMPRSYSDSLNRTLAARAKQLAESLSGYTLENALSVMEEFSSANQSRVVLLDENGGIVREWNGLGDALMITSEIEGSSEGVSEEFASTVETMEADNIQTEEGVSMVEQMEQQAMGRYEVAFKGTDHKYTLFVFGSTQLVNQAVEALGQILPWMLLTVFAVSLLIALFYSRYLSKPVQKLGAASDKMANLDFSVRTDMKRIDEIGVLSRSLDTMAESLDQALSSLWEANAKLKDEMEQERELEQQRMEFFAAASHELKTPVTILKGQIEGMEQNVGVYKDRDKYLARAREVTVTLQNMVQEILVISRMESCGFSLKKKEMDMAELVRLQLAGGKAVYPSSVLMNIVPAKVAGVPHIVMTTPPGKDGKVNPSTLVAAKEAGADEIYKVGGAQAIGALAYGTASIPKVDKIVGPGNIFVALAKKAVYGHVSIDSIAGPSEILVLADGTANAHYVAADLLSQAEHDEMASAILITTSTELAQNVEKEIEGYLKVLSRKEIIEKSLENFGYILIAEDMDEAIEAANEIASEHMEIVTKNAFEVMMKVRNAGAIFIGEYSSEPLGDYFAGPNHVLPTNGTAKFFSALSVDDFIKKSSIVYYSRTALQEIHKDIIQFASSEQLTAHANSIAVRFEEEDKKEQP